MRVKGLLTVVLLGVVVGAAFAGANAKAGGSKSLSLTPGDLLVSRSVYDNNPANIQVGDVLPPGCTSGCVAAVADGTYPYVFNNAPVDGSFGITSRIYLDELTPSGTLVNSLELPNSSDNGVPPTKDQMVTSFSSKSELALNLSTGGQYVTFMGYLAPIDAVDVSNSNTPGVTDPTNPVPGAVSRVVAQIDAHGKIRYTATNAYSGNNGRAAILNEAANVFYTAGNAGNGANPQPAGIVDGAGAQIFDAQTKALVAQDPGQPTPVGSFDVTQLGDAQDKIGKDDNFRGLTEFNNVLYYTKGSGGNGIDTVYFLDTTGKACPSTSATPGVGLPQPGATLPTAPLSIPADVTTAGLPSNMCILKGFPTLFPDKKSTNFPFGLWFANSTTLYVADEGNGTTTFKNGIYTADQAQTNAGLEKWSLVNGAWKLDYTLQNGLALGSPYTPATVSGGPTYPSGTNAATGLPWTPATDGLRNLTGQVNSDGTVTIWAVTSTVSGSGDQGADPNELVSITDNLSATTLPAAESFNNVDGAASGEVLRGVSFTPGTAAGN